MIFTGQNFDEIDEYLKFSFSIVGDKNKIRISDFPSSICEDILIKKGDEVPTKEEIYKMMWGK